MNKQYLRLLGLDEAATQQDVQTAYDALHAKYLEERFMEGEVGNNAARMLTQIDTAYRGLMDEFAEEQGNVEEGKEQGSAFSRVEELIRSGELEEAQRIMDNFNERGAQWHYLQSVLFYKKGWINESKKQLEIAMRLEPNNEKYKESYRKLSEKAFAENTQQQTTGGTYQGQSLNDSYGDGEMGGDFCTSCMQCIACNILLNCFCNGCCH